MSEARFVTYKSENAGEGKEWIAWILLNGEYLPVYFFGCSEGEACGKAMGEWEKHKEERERNIAAREEGRRKAVETRERKKAMAR